MSRNKKAVEQTTVFLYSVYISQGIPLLFFLFSALDFQISLDLKTRRFVADCRLLSLRLLRQDVFCL